MLVTLLGIMTQQLTKPREEYISWRQIYLESTREFFATGFLNLSLKIGPSVLQHI
jgi:hypothetical protein